MVDQAPALLGEGTEIAHYEGDRIKHLETTWTQETIARNIEWATEHGQKVPGHEIERLQQYVHEVTPAAELFTRAVEVSAFFRASIVAAIADTLEPGMYERCVNDDVIAECLRRSRRDTRGDRCEGF